MTSYESRGAALLVLLLLAASSSIAFAGFSADCAVGSVWMKKQKKTKDPVERDLSTCQQQALGMKGNDNLIGGKGSASVVYVPIGSGDGGCTGGNSCMEICQAICCLMSDCVYATVKKDTDTKDYVVYQESETSFYCRTYSTASGYKDSDTETTCQKDPVNSANDNCASLVANSVLKLNSSTYGYLLSLQNNNSCGSKRRLLQSTPKVEGAGSFSFGKKEMAGILQTKVFDKFSDIKSKLLGALNDEDTCKQKIPKLKKKLNKVKCN